MIELSNILPSALAACFDSLAYEQSSGLTVDSIEWLSDELHFNFSIYLGDFEKNEVQGWQLRITGYRDSKIDTDNLGEYFEFYSEHILLADFIDTQTELYFRKSTIDPKWLFADIYLAHNTLFEGRIPLEKYINGGHVFRLCNSNHGLFAIGPKSVLSQYYECLAKAGKEPYFLGDSPAKIWDGGKWVDEVRDLKVAVLGGTYFIGSDFIFTRR